MKRYNVFHRDGSYLGYVIAKDFAKAQTAAISRYGCVIDKIELVNPADRAIIIGA